MKTRVCLKYFVNDYSHKASKFKFGDSFKITTYKTIFSKCCTKKYSREIFAIDSVQKTNPWTYKIKDLNGENIKGKFYGK